MRLDLQCKVSKNLILLILDKVLRSGNLGNIYEPVVISCNTNNNLNNKNFCIVARLVDFKGRTEKLVRCSSDTRIILKPIITDSNEVRYVDLEISATADWNPLSNTKSEPDEFFDEKLFKDFHLIAQGITELAIEMIGETETSNLLK